MPLAKSSEQAEAPINKPTMPIEAPTGLAGHEWAGVPIDLMRHFGCELGNTPSKDLEILKEVSQLAKSRVGADASIGDILQEIAKVQRELGAPKLNEKAYQRVHQHMKMQKVIDEMRKRQDSLKGGFISFCLMALICSTAYADVKISALPSITSNTSSDVIPTVHSGTTSQIALGNVTVGKATALATTPTQCNAGYYPLGIDTGGNVQNCTLAGAGGGGTWGSITGTLSSQTDLQTALNGKQASLGLTQGTYTDGKLCSYTASGTVLNCTTSAGGTGTVTSIATTSPIQGGTITGTGTISIQQANTSNDGYLSHTDWNTFNGKQAALGLTAGTMTDGKYCTYTASGAVLSCNSAGGSGASLSANNTWTGNQYFNNNNTVVGSAGSTVYDTFTVNAGGTGGTTINGTAGGIGGIDGNTQLYAQLNNGVTDSSQNGYTLSNTGVTFANTIPAISGQYYGVFNGSSYVSVPANSNWNFGSADFEVDGWVKVTALPTAGTLQDFLCTLDGAANNGFRFGLINSSGTQKVEMNLLSGGGSNSTATITYTMTTGTWHFVEFMRNSGTDTVCVDGSSIGTVTNYSVGNTSSVMGIGAQALGGSFSNYLSGILYGFRVSTGTSRGAGCLTVPSVPYNNSSLSTPTITLAAAGNPISQIQTNSSTNTMSIINNSITS